MKIRTILESKGRRVRCVAPDASVMDAIRMMADNDIGSLMVTDGDDIVGIVSERDCLRQLARSPETVNDHPVLAITSRDIVVACDDDNLAYVMEAMVKKGCRHVPVIHDGELAGMISIRDVVRAQLDETHQELKFLREYIQGGGA